MTSTYPRTIENGAGERLTFLGLRAGAEGRQYLDVESRVAPAAGPPMHVHYLQQETITVKDGPGRLQHCGRPRSVPWPRRDRHVPTGGDASLLERWRR